MAVPTDISLMDFLLERDDNILSVDKDSISKSDRKDVEGMDVSYRFLWHIKIACNTSNQNKDSSLLFL